MRKFKHLPLIPPPAFVGRILKALALAVSATGVSLFAGMVGYHGFENLSWTDSFLNAAMILGGMGEVAELKTQAGKIFAGFYALYSGLLVLASMGVILAPVLHWILYHFHVDEE
jgi:hypothetical protein